MSSSADWADSDSDEDPDYIPTDERDEHESCSDEYCSDDEELVDEYYVENIDMLDDLANFAENRLWLTRQDRLKFILLLVNLLDEQHNIRADSPRPDSPRPAWTPQQRNHLIDEDDRPSGRFSA